MKALRAWRWRDWPWATKLSVLLAALALLPLVVITGVNEAVVRATAIDSLYERNLQHASHTAGLLGRYLEGIVGDVTIVSQARTAHDVLRGIGGEARRRSLQMVLEDMQRTKRIEALFIVDQEATVIASSLPSMIGTNWIAAPFFLSGMAGQVRVHEPRYVPADNAVQLNVSVPIRHEGGAVLGVAVARVSLAELEALVAADDNYGGLGEFGTLWDEHGIVLSSPSRPERRFRPESPLLDSTRDRLIAEQRFGPETRRLLDEAGPASALVDHIRWRLYDPEADARLVLDSAAGRCYLASVPVSGTRWTYGVAVLESRAFAAIREQRRRSLIVAILTALLSIGVAVVVARRAARPLARVGEAAQALAAGDMTQRVGLTRHDEVGQLAQTFDRMADALADQDAVLRRHAEVLEQRVNERTAELQALLGAIPDLIFKVSADGRLLDYVAAKDEDLAMPPEQFLGRRLDEVLPPDLAEQAMSRVARALAGAAVEPLEYRLPVGGEERYYEARVSASGADTAVFLVRDVTLRHRAEERTHFLARAGAVLGASLDHESTLELVPTLAVPFLADICVLDLQDHGQIRCERVAAVTREQGALVRALWRVPPDAPGRTHPVVMALAGHATLFASVTPDLLERMAGTANDARGLQSLGITSLMVLPLRARGQMLGALTFISTTEGRRYGQADLALARELAERAAVALDNARLYREVQEASRLKDEFLGTVSHELRTPLNAVLGWTQVLRRGPADAAQAARGLEAIERNARAQAQLVEDLLDTSRVVSGKLRVEPVPTDAGPLVDAVVESFRPLAHAREIDLHVSLEAGRHIIQADQGRLQQVLSNLLANALKFTPAGGAVHVTVRRAGATIEIAVRDSGQGIAPEFLPHVFDRFRQQDSTTTRAHGGLGLGLSIAQHLVELQGGSIRAESEGPSRGATFTIALPISSEPAPASPDRHDGARRLDAARVLIVDDAPDARTLFEAVLGGAGAQVMAAASAAEGRALLAAARPDVLIADIGMPGEDGFSLIRSVRAAEARAGHARVPAVAVTAYAAPAARNEARAAGFDLFLTKPVEPAELLRAIAELLGARAGGV